MEAEYGDHYGIGEVLRLSRVEQLRDHIMSLRYCEYYGDD